MNFGYVASKIKNVENEEKFLLKQNCHKINLLSEIKLKKINFLFVLGGDGFMLRALHKFINSKVNFYGINCGTNGFLLNNFQKIKDKKLDEIVKNTKKYVINSLESTITNKNNKQKRIYAINEISLLRNTHNASHIKIYIDNIERLSKLISDGVIVSSPAGSTAYNLSLNGPVLPLDSNFLSITPISSFKPRLWKGAILKNTQKIRFEILDYDTRGVNVTADFIEFKNIKNVEIAMNTKKNINLLFNKDESMEEKIINQQFLV